ncbi:MAG: hypothetical protein ACJLUP_21725 [Agrobacterium tumefaciens]
MQGLNFDSEIIESVKQRESKLAEGAQAETEFMTALWQGDVGSARRALEDVMDAVAAADARIAGWYSVWIGMTYEAEGDLISAGQHYRKARSRTSKWLNLPFTVDNFGATSETKPLSAIHAQLMSSNSQGPGALSDLSAKLKASLRKFKDPDLDADGHEEALRNLGELIGLESTRPDNEFEAGPDVIWHDPLTKYSLAMELKTKKAKPAVYFKKDIGQALNHVGWMRENRPDDKIDGVLVVGPNGKCNSQANPSDELYLVDMDTLSTLVESFIAKLDDFRGRITAERDSVISEFGSLSEWQLQGWLKNLNPIQLKALK